MYRVAADLEIRKRHSRLFALDFCHSVVSRASLCGRCRCLAPERGILDEDSVAEDGQVKLILDKDKPRPIRDPGDERPTLHGDGTE